MGKRVNYEILNEDGKPSVILYANSADASLDTDLIFIKNLREHLYSEGTERLLAMRYDSKSPHSAYSRIFSIDLCPNDREYVIQATYYSQKGFKFAVFGDITNMSPKVRRLIDVVHPFPSQEGK